MTGIKSGTVIRRRFTLAVIGSLVGGAALLLGTLRAEASTMPTYAESRIASEYTGGGTAQGWTSDENSWPLSLPFQFPFYDRTYSQAYVSSNGYLTFGSGAVQVWPDIPVTKGIFPYAGDHYARHPGGNIAQDIRVSSSASQAKVTWNTETYLRGGTTEYTYTQPTNAENSSFFGGMGWRADDSYWSYDLDFAFPFYGERFSRIYVGSNGYLTFGSGSTTLSPSLDTMKGIFGFGRDLRTDCPDDDIHVFDDAQGATIAWYAHTYNANCALAQRVRFYIKLYPNGRIQVVYKDIADPTTGHVTGISKGDGVNKVVSLKDHAPVASLTLDDNYAPNGGYPVNVEVVLKPSGEIRMRYGDMQDPSSATVGVSRGDNVNYQTIAGYNGATIPSNAQTVVLTRQPSTDPPVISGYQVTPAIFSPNEDGQNETATFSGSWNRYGTWSLAVKDASGATVRAYSGPSATSFSQAWDGKNGSGAPVADGSYTATLTVTDIDGVVATANATVYADVAGPTISGLAASPTPFSPNADGTKDSTTISATLADPSPPITWALAIKNILGTTIRSYSGSGVSVAQVWDGKDSGGTTVASGPYNAALTSYDSEGNQRITTTTATVDLDRPSIYSFAASQSSFSPNADGTMDSTTFTATTSDESTPVAWSLAIKDASNATVRTYTGSGTPVSQAWDGKNDSGAVVPDGTYRASLTATDTQNLSYTTLPVTITVDDAAPVISGYLVSPNPFSPNGDGTKDTTTFSATISESNTWTLDVKNGSGAIVRSFAGSITGVSQVWDGKDAAGAVVPDATDYTGVLKATDAAGNSTTSMSTPVTLDTAVPVISGLVAAPTPFSPNADGTKDATVISASISESASWSLEVKSGASVVRTYPGSGTSVSQTWDGKNGSGTVQPQGAYTPTLTATDPAGNRATGTTTATIDLVAPTISGFAASAPYFSPNADGTKDTTTLSATVSDASTPVAWAISIKNGSNTVVRTYSGSGNISQVWDGKDSGGVVVAQGTYTATATATDTQNISASSSISVVVDTIAPAIAGYGASQTPFSPNADGVRDSTTFSASVSDSSTPINWSLSIKNAADILVRSYSGTGNPTQSWDGRNTPGAVVPDGAYTGALTATDQAGNSATSSISVVVDTAAPTISTYTASPTPFSPNADGTKDSTTFNATLSDPSTPLNWTLTLRNSADTLVRTFSGSGTSVSQAWDGKDSSNAVVPDGAYTGTLAGTDAAGNSSNSPATVVVDRTAPSITGFAASQTLFSPNGDGTKDSTTLSASIADASTPVAWSLAIKNSSDTLVRAYTGSGSSVLQAWDGKDGTGAVVPDGSYTATLTATDTQNLSSTSDPVTITVDTVAPAISGYSASPTPFSPNGDLVKDSTTFAATLSESASWTLDITYAGSGENWVDGSSGSGTGASYAWDGKTPAGFGRDTMEDGTYTGTLVATDPAGNRASAATDVVLDNHGPVISDYAASNNPFSPNGDGTKDSTVLSATLTEQSTPVGWTLDIKNAAGVPLRSFSGTGSSLSQTWDGRNTAGLYVSDGTYNAVLKATDEVNNATTASLSIVVDDAAPIITGLAVSPDPFSPNADGTKDSSTFSAAISDASSPVTWNLAVKNSLGLTVRSWSGSGTSVSEVWDGKDSLGSIVPDDTYTATLSATDSQNLSDSDSTTIDVDTVAPTLSGSGFAPATFSPNADSVKDTSTFAADASEQVTWSLAIKNSSGDTVRSFTGSGAPVSQAWNGKDVAVASIADGIYTARLSATDPAGNSSSSSASVTIDTVAPSINGYAASPTPFSPNADGVKDAVTLSASLADPTTPLGWALTFKDAAGTTMASFTGAGDLVSQAWDGKNASGSVVPDALYHATLAASDDAGNIGVAAVSVRVDTRAPVIAGLAASPTSFSPNADGTLDSTTISAGISDDSPVDWALAVKNDTGDTVRSFSGATAAVSQVWDGKNDQGALAPNATYTLALTATDAQSLVATASASVILDTAAPLITSYAATPDPFSPNADGKVETTTFSGTISKPATWTMSIRDSGGTTRRTFSGSGTTLSQDWDGKNASGTVLGDGTYTAGLTLTDALGNTTSAPSTTVVIDKTPPTISDLTATNLAFSPNGDGSKDTTKFQANLSDASAPISWTATVKNAQGATVVTISGTCDLGTAACGNWDGKDSSGAVVADGVYSTALSAEDAAENASPAVPGRSITVDTVALAIPFETMNPPYGGNTILSPMPLTAKIPEISSVTASSVQFKMDGVPISTSWDSTTGWARSTPQAFNDGSIHTAEVTATDLAGNKATFTWPFKKIRFAPQSATFTMFGTGVDSGQAGSLPGSRRWTFDPVVTIGERWLKFPDGSKHAGWGTLASTLSLNDAKVVITDFTGTHDWIQSPYAGVVKTVYQQMSYTSLNGDPRTTYVAPTSVGLPSISVDLPTTTTAASVVLGSDEQPVQTSASAVGVCSDATVGGAISGCSADPLRVFLGKELAGLMDTYVDPPSPPVGDPPAELPTQLAFGVLQEQIDPLNPVPYSGGGWNGVWRDIESGLSAPCVQNPNTEAVCEFGGVDYPSGLPPLVPSNVDVYCRASAFCYDSAAFDQSGQEQTDNTKRAPKHQCIAIIGNPQTKWPTPGMDQYSVPTDSSGQPTATCTQGWGTAVPKAPKNGTVVGAYQVWGSWGTDWGVQDGPADEMGVNFVGTFKTNDGKYMHVPWQPDYAYSSPAVYTSHVYPYDGVYPQDETGVPLPDALDDWQHCVADSRRVRDESAYMYLAEGGVPPYGIGTGLGSDETGDYTKHGWDQYYPLSGKSKCPNANPRWDGYVFVRHRSSQIIGNVIAYTYPGYTFGKTRSDGMLTLTYGHVVRSYSYSWKTGATCAVEDSWGAFWKCAFLWLFSPDTKDTEETHHPLPQSKAFSYKSNY